MFRIFTDAASNLPAELLREYDIKMLPVSIRISGEELDLSAGFDGHAFYDRMRAGEETQTAMPSPGTMLDAFTPFLEGGEDILYVSMSGGISGTAALASSVAAELTESYPDRRVAVVDSRGASLGQGIPAIYAAKCRADGLPFQQVVTLTEDYCRHTHQVFTVDDLKYLKRNGRLYAAAVKVTNLLNVKPILIGDKDGHIVLRFMNVGRRRALETLAGNYRCGCIDKTAPVGIAHADCEEDAAFVVDRLRKYGCTGEITTVLYEPVTGSHVGPGTVALFFRGAERWQV